MSNIKETNITNPPSSYEAYLYTFTNLKNDKQYVGIHKGSVDDAYNHSSTNDDFKEVFSNAKSKLKFEVNYFGSYPEMQTLEYKILSKVDARNNDMYYNKSNGYPIYEELDLEKCEFLAKQIQDGIYDVGKESLKKHENMSYIQVRFQHDPALQKEIKEKVNDANGNTDDCNAVVVYEQRGENGEDLRGDGNHTVFGASQSKHAVDIPVARVPWVVHKDYTTAELKGVGNLLNRKSKITKKEIDQQTGIKHVKDNYFLGVPHNSNSNVEWLKAFGFTKSQVNSIIKKSKDLIDKDELLKNNLLFIDYKAKPHNQTLIDTVAAYAADPNVCSIQMSSAKFSSDRIIETLYANRSLNKNLGKRICQVIIHHKSPEQEHIWKTADQARWINMLSYLLCDGFMVKFYEMPSTMSDGTQT
jgi:hypothetical protein